MNKNDISSFGLLQLKNIRVCCATQMMTNQILFESKTMNLD